MDMERRLTAKKALCSTPLHKVLDFMLQHPELELCDTEIAGQFNDVGKSAVNIALRKLAAAGLVGRTARGSMVLNRLIDSPLTAELRIASNLIALHPLIDRLSSLCIRIVLFGSRADGSHTSESDYDLYIVSSEEKSILGIIGKDVLAERIQPVIKTPEQALSFDADEPALSVEVKRGKVLWERK